MGVQDRDWYAEHQRKRESAPHQNAPRNTETPQLRDLPGVNWHWTVKLMAYGLTLLAILIAIRHFKG